MKEIKLYSIILLASLLVGCATTKEQKVDKKQSTVQKNGTSKLTEKEQLNFKYYFHNATKERILGNYQEALTLFMKCLVIAPEESAPYYEVAKLAAASKQTELALEYAKKAVKLDPENYWYGILHAETLQQAGKFEEAITAYKKLLEKDGNNVELHFELAGMQLYTGKYKASIASFNEIEKRMGITEELSIQKEKIYIKMGDVDGAANEVQQLIDHEPDNLKYQVLLADLYLANEMEEKAVKVYHEILAKDPNNPYANLSLYEYYLKKEEK